MDVIVDELGEAISNSIDNHHGEGSGLNLVGICQVDLTVTRMTHEATGRHYLTHQEEQALLSALKNGRRLRGNAHLPSAAGCFFKALAQALTSFTSDRVDTLPEEEQLEEDEQQARVAARRQHHDERALTCLREELGNFTVMRGMSLADVKRYEEELNDKRTRTVAISVFVYEKEEGYIPALPSPRRADAQAQHVHLLLVPSQVEDKDKGAAAKAAKAGKTLFDKMQAQHY